MLHLTLVYDMICRVIKMKNSKTAWGIILSLTGGITYGIAIPIIMGQNIGTCVTAVISSIGVSRNAKKVAVVHLSFNIIGTLICLIPFYFGNMIFKWAFVEEEITPFMIAVCHSIFNILTTFSFVLFANKIEYVYFCRQYNT